MRLERGGSGEVGGGMRRKLSNEHLKEKKDERAKSEQRKGGVK